ncbi:MAG TPA: DUF1015 domain-containing protein [Spirochaetia bacterium]|nr:DUF1015 domain-containing protein [Spirochaetales bacterium]HRS64784.1 DUF1015 domain-containing protein [Spirochaetia bacterium]HRV29442.1 DUF1015 domain-containing protein [Spirochaetia bacterium]
MTGLEERFSRLGVSIPDVMLPASGIDMTRWAVVACDQYSSEPEYWEEVKAFVGSHPSTYNLIYPECYLEAGDKPQRIATIQKAMHDYLGEGIVQNIGKGFILVERYTPFEKHPRKGLIFAVDLEAYQFGKQVTSMVRPTEGTILERLPPRMEIRRGAPLELPHIMLLIDDPCRTVIEPLYARMSDFKTLYDFDLMQKAGHIKGVHITDERTLATIADALETLQHAFTKKYADKAPLLFAVGDGNHSLATAKQIWEEIKKANSGNPGIMNHPARYALVELVNIYDEGLPFHPIHRVLFKADKALLEKALQEAGAHIEPMPFAEAVKHTDDIHTTEHRFVLIHESGTSLVRFSKPQAVLATSTIQAVLDGYLKAHQESGIDYIHGTESLEQLAKKPGNLGLYLPPVRKDTFFTYIIEHGVMPRKTFSMGEAPEKRFYIEARKIV